MEAIKKFSNSGVCWWCGSKADSNEHKIKRSVFTKFYGKGSYMNNNHRPVLVKEGKEQVLQSSSDSRLTFAKTLCCSCNNDRSSRFDLAYDTFLDYCSKNMSFLCQKGKIDFEKIFGFEWKEKKYDLFRYFVKFHCGQIATGKYQVSDEVIGFLNGDHSLNHIKVEFQIKLGILDLMEVLSIQNIDYNHIYIGATTFHGKGSDVFTLFNWFTINGFSVNLVYNLNIGKSSKYPLHDLSKKIEEIAVIDTIYPRDEVVHDFHDLIDLAENSDVNSADRFKSGLVTYILNKG